MRRKIKRGAQRRINRATSEKTEKATSPSVDYFFTNLGGGIAKAILLTHLGENGANVALNEFGTVPIGAVSEIPGEGENASYKVEVNQPGGEVVCERTTPEQMQIVKKFTLPQATKGKDEYLVKLDLSFTNRGAQPLQAGWLLRLRRIVGGGSRARPAHLHFIRLVSRQAGGHECDLVFCAPYSGDRHSDITRAARLIPQPRDNIAWAGVSSQYFTTIVTPTDGKGVSVWARRFQFDFEERTTGRIDLARRGTSTAQPYAIEGALGMPGFTLAPGQTVHAQFHVYVGPKEYGLLKRLGRKPRKRS